MLFWNNVNASKVQYLLFKILANVAWVTPIKRKSERRKGSHFITLFFNLLISVRAWVKFWGWIRINVRVRVGGLVWGRGWSQEINFLFLRNKCTTAAYVLVTVFQGVHFYIAHTRSLLRFEATLILFCPTFNILYLNEFLRLKPLPILFCRRKPVAGKLTQNLSFVNR